MSDKFNKEGYFDKVQYDADRVLRPAEIREYRGNFVLILRVDEEFCNVVQLFSQKHLNCTFCLHGKSDYFCNPLMVSYAFNDSIGSFVERCPDSVFDDFIEFLDDFINRLLEKRG